MVQNRKVALVTGAAMGIGRAAAGRGGIRCSHLFQPE